MGGSVPRSGISIHTGQHGAQWPPAKWATWTWTGQKPTTSQLSAKDAHWLARPQGQTPQAPTVSSVEASCASSNNCKQLQLQLASFEQQLLFLVGQHLQVSSSISRLCEMPLASSTDGELCFC